MRRKLYNLLDKWKDKHRKYLKYTLDSVNTESTEQLISAEKKHRKLRAGAVVFSPPFSMLGLAWKFCQKLVQYKQKRFFDWKYLDCTARYLHPSTLLGLPTIKCIQNLKLAKKKYLKAKSAQQEIR